jgi:mono/diheme cytochrome c family protein
MNKKILTAFLFLSVLLYECATQKPVVILYEFPENFTADQKDYFVKECEKGKILFQIHCAKCHGIFAKGNDSIPNFSKEELANYSIKNMTRSTHDDSRKFSTDQLNSIVFFLQYKKSNFTHSKVEKL